MIGAGLTELYLSNHDWIQNRIYRISDLGMSPTDAASLHAFIYSTMSKHVWLIIPAAIVRYELDNAPGANEFELLYFVNRADTRSAVTVIRNRNEYISAFFRGSRNLAPLMRNGESCNITIKMMGVFNLRNLPIVIGTCPVDKVNKAATCFRNIMKGGTIAHKAEETLKKMTTVFYYPDLCESLDSYSMRIIKEILAGCRERNIRIEERSGSPAGYKNNGLFYTKAELLDSYYDQTNEEEIWKIMKEKYRLPAAEVLS